MRWGLLKKGFTEEVNLGGICYHIIDSVKNARKCLGFFCFQKIPFQIHDTPVPTSGLCDHSRDTSFHPPLIAIVVISIVQKNRNKMSCPQI